PALCIDIFVVIRRRPPRSPLFPYTTLFRSYVGGLPQNPEPPLNYQVVYSLEGVLDYYTTMSQIVRGGRLQEVEALSEVEPVEFRSEEHTSELQSRENLVCRLLLEKKKNIQ